MGTRTLMWLIFGVFLLIAGLISSVREGGETPQQRSAPSQVRNVPDRMSAVGSVPEAETGFTIDPIKGLRRKDDQNAEYFK